MGLIFAEKALYGSDAVITNPAIAPSQGANPPEIVCVWQSTCSEALHLSHRCRVWAKDRASEGYQLSFV